MNTSARQPVDHAVAHAADLAEIRRRRWQALGLVLLSIPVGLVIPWITVQLIGNAQAECLDLEAGGRFALFGLWILLALVSAWAFLLGCLAAWKLPTAGRVAVGLALVLVICLVATSQTVPIGSASDYPTAVGECGVGGVPTWWPPFPSASLTVPPRPFGFVRRCGGTTARHGSGHA